MVLKKRHLLVVPINVDSVKFYVNMSYKNLTKLNWFKSLYSLKRGEGIWEKKYWLEVLLLQSWFFLDWLSCIFWRISKERGLYRSQSVSFIFFVFVGVSDFIITFHFYLLFWDKCNNELWIFPRNLHLYNIFSYILD